MRQQPIPDDSLSEAEAIRMVRGLAPSRNAEPSRDRDCPAIAPALLAPALLARTVENEVIPRLLKARRLQKRPASGLAGQPVGEDHVAELTRLVLTGTAAETHAYVGSLHACGAGADTLLLDLLSRTARRLGVMWEEDACDFSDVTLGVLRLNNVLRLVGAAFDPPAFDHKSMPDGAAPTALLVQAPGEQHGFGLAMVVHFFRRAGWNVRSEPVATADDLARLVKANWFGLVGLSASCGDRLETLASHVGAIRAASRNRAVSVMVGGPPFIDHPQLAGMIGADGTAPDGSAAVRQAEALVSNRARTR